MGGLWGLVGGGGTGQGRCNKGSEVFVKIEKKIVGVGDVNEELNFL